MKFFLASPFLCLLLFVSPSAFAQNAQELNDKLYRLERDLQILQKQYYRDEEKQSRKRNVVKTNVNNAPSAQVEVQLIELEEEMRRLRGEVEEVKFDIGRLQKRFDLFEQDMDARLAAQEQDSPAPPADSRPIMPPVTNELPQVLGDDIPQPVETIQIDDAPVEIASPAPTPETPKEAPTQPVDASQARSDYDAAFKLLNQTNYEQAATAFDAFIKQYPNSALIGNAYYWLGETHYVRSDHLNAAETFRLGFEKMPGGPKAPDNLLKLAMSLNALERKEEACVVLTKLTADFSDSSDVIGRKSKQEFERVGCKK